MSQNLAEKIMDLLGRVDEPWFGELYHKLILAVAPPGSGKTNALLFVAASLNLRYVNVSLELSRGLLWLTEKQRRGLRAKKVLESVVGEVTTGPVLLDNIELLFNPSLGLEPLSLLGQFSRHRVVVTAWPGGAGGGHLTYAEPGHAEHKVYQLDRTVLVVSP